MSLAPSFLFKNKHLSLRETKPTNIRNNQVGMGCGKYCFKAWARHWEKHFFGKETWSFE